jgi:hypothetical protein
MADLDIKVLNFEAEVRRVRKEALKIADDDFNSQMLAILKGLKRATPVDTGHAASRWSMKLGKDAKGQPSCEITNDAGYIMVLNRGHSQQAPSYFIEQILSAAGLSGASAVKATGSEK